MPVWLQRNLLWTTYCFKLSFTTHIRTYVRTYVRTRTQNDIETNASNLLSLYIFFRKVLQILLSNKYSPVLWSNCFVDQCPSWGFPLICSSRRVVLGRWQRGTAEAEWSLRNKSKPMNKNSPWGHTYISTIWKEIKQYQKVQFDSMAVTSVEEQPFYRQKHLL